MSRVSRNDPAPGRTLRSPFALAAWMLLAAALFSAFIMLGNWQVRRLHWKLDLIRDVATRVHAPPVDAPGPAQWASIARGQQQYLHVRLHGRFLEVQPTLVHGTSALGYGFWVIAPLRTDRGFIVLVNRGYIPATLPGTPAYSNVTPPGEASLSGLLRLSEPGGGFLRPNRPAADQWYSRDVSAMASARGLPTAQVAPYFVDADADAPDLSGSSTWPRAGLTVTHFPNNHLAYLITWYLLALGVFAAAIFVGREEWRMHRSAPGR